jgi:hypothetical protein
MSNNITLSQLASMADDAWLNEPVVGVARLIAQKTSKAGKPFWQLSLTDKDDPSIGPRSGIHPFPGRFSLRR